MDDPLVWEPRPRPVNLGTFTMRVGGSASSSWTVEDIDRRLRALHGVTTPEAERERDYLLALRSRTEKGA